MRCFTLLSVILIPIVLSQDVIDFGDNDQTPVQGSDVNPKTGVQVDEDDVNTRFFDVDLNSFAGQVAASALGTVVGNAGVNLAGNLLSNCNKRGKRSILMHKLEKRQAIEGNERTGNTNADPEVATRFICPQDLLNPGGSSGNNNGRYCDRCYCSDWDCRRDCRKCGNSGASGWSSSSGNNNGWSSSSGNNNWGQSSSNQVNCNNCYCSSNSCRNTCNKCASNNNNGHYNNNNNGHYQSSSNSGHYQSSTTTTSVNCNSCSCSNYSCKRSCRNRCRSNNSGWNNGGSYNNGYRNSNSVNGRSGENSGDAEVVASQDNSEQKTTNGAESVVFA